MLVHLCIKATKIMSSKVSVCRPFIVNKETAETNRRFAAYNHTFFQFHSIAVGRKHASPVYQRRNAHKLRKMEKSVDRTTLVASNDDDFVGADCKNIALALSSDFCNIGSKTTLCSKLFCKRSFAQGRKKHSWFGRLPVSCPGRSNNRLFTGYPLHIKTDLVCNLLYARKLVFCTNKFYISIKLKHF